VFRLGQIRAQARIDLRRNARVQAAVAKLQPLVTRLEIFLRQELCDALRRGDHTFAGLWTAQTEWRRRARPLTFVARAGSGAAFADVRVFPLIGCCQRASSPLPDARA
jgi:hypothetical protein